MKIKDRDNQIENLREMTDDLKSKLKATQIEKETQTFKRILAEDSIKSKNNELSMNNSTMNALRTKYENL